MKTNIENVMDAPPTMGEPPPVPEIEPKMGVMIADPPPAEMGTRSVPAASARTRA